MNSFRCMPSGSANSVSYLSDVEFLSERLREEYPSAHISFLPLMRFFTRIMNADRKMGEGYSSCDALHVQIPITNRIRLSIRLHFYNYIFDGGFVNTVVVLFLRFYFQTIFDGSQKEKMNC
ncbi:hypothetical protein TNCT_578321 [Trichonephila clavata]|uniref:Uncharacterized protein n=1 Tax=Trichonephila clavata TaxID=2740835 RepID=A0A8X6LR10_TRICU|nr:hypothetical protein TNCT_578321 [Trichonephila clavata]